ncbi:MAG: sigma-70 family RNA polymerase sigma factor [Bacteroidales bacterium]|nr:sigma-70 family RNA polymerase sigma factor [Bacteroidales bacterium]
MGEGSEKFLTERELIDGCRRNDRRAQKQLYDLYAPRMLAVCMRYTGSRENAKDVMQEGFLTVFDKIGTYKGQGSFEGWMRRVFANQSLMYIRKNDALKYADEIDSVPESGLGLESGDPLGALGAKEIMELISAMPAGFRSVFNLYVLEGYSHQEIAEALGITEGSSRSQLSRGRIWLQERIKKF